LKNIHHRQQSEVAFSDTDASGWAHFSKILCYVENAEHVFLASMGIPVFSNSNGWPRVKISCDYRSPLRSQDKFEVQLGISKIINFTSTGISKSSNPKPPSSPKAKWSA
jgi:acyl-CoA thioesterase FadM